MTGVLTAAPGALIEYFPPRSAKDDLEYILREWQRRLNLTHWLLKINWDSQPVNEDDAGVIQWADIQWGDTSDDAVIRFHEKYTEWDRENMNHTVVHELIHLVLRDLQAGVESASDVMPAAAYKVFDNRFTHELEGVTERIAKLIVAFGGLV